MCPSTILQLQGDRFGVIISGSAFELFASPSPFVIFFRPLRIEIVRLDFVLLLVCMSGVERERESSRPECPECPGEERPDEVSRYSIPSAARWLVF